MRVFHAGMNPVAAKDATNRLPVPINRANAQHSVNRPLFLKFAVDLGSYEVDSSFDKLGGYSLFELFFAGHCC
jgi:hypothetical protein